MSTDPRHVLCMYCDSIITALDENDEMLPGFEQCYRQGKVPVPNAGWLCSQECASLFETTYNVQFDRNSVGMVDYYPELAAGN